MQRPGLQSLLDLAARGGLDVILCEALDRLSRDQADVATLYKQLEFHNVRIVTLSEGEVNELHVGLKGTMNQMFLKDLAAKTRRGLRGRVESGKSGGGNAYGYAVVRRLGADGLPLTGEREIIPEEAAIIRRVFEEFADGYSPKAIARRLNDDGTPGPRGGPWRDTAIRGHRIRGTGLLNNELYLGRLVWNRLRYVKDPATGKRVSRLNPESDWVIQDVPELRIISDELWTSVKARQLKIDATPAVQGIRKSTFLEKRRGPHLLTGKLACACCGGTFAAVGRDYLACSNARKLGTCDARKSIKRAVLEEAVLDLLRDRLMQPDAVAEFVSAFTKTANAERASETASRQQAAKALKELERKLQGLYDAIADGFRTPGLLQQLEELEARKAALHSTCRRPPLPRCASTPGWRSSTARRSLSCRRRCATRQSARRRWTCSAG
ncbi:recombinase family protein [Alloyangia pacifica]|uniref:Recombinase zinc beta ribbon domain-containing protein n=1 Tax=Alloyangia pacifica TaxID=311180 RepID=A0A1I6WNP8_9RHOB|nr:recombinase family protein [Alloyangia pacifica]SDJ00084.1 Recombinase zinc beta ribbon domain-containing protein [Alloyangia pacifica]SFT27638.1 Recombinase zinc beta ribbon domain-containing protein [Alloyangia pacifica]